MTVNVQSQCHRIVQLALSISLLALVPTIGRCQSESQASPWTCCDEAELPGGETRVTAVAVANPSVDNRGWSQGHDVLLVQHVHHPSDPQRDEWGVVFLAPSAAWKFALQRFEIRQNGKVTLVAGEPDFMPADRGLAVFRLTDPLLQAIAAGTSIEVVFHGLSPEVIDDERFANVTPSTDMTTSFSLAGARAALMQLGEATDRLAKARASR